VARTTKQRARQLKHDAFRDSTMGFVDRVSHRLEGKGWTILYALAALVALAILFSVYTWWSGRRADEARAALGKAIEIAEAPVTTGTPLPNATGPTFPSERERAQRAVEEFRKVQEQYGSPYSELARYFAAANLLTVEREQGLQELEAIGRGGDSETAARARFALAQAREADGQLDSAAALYQELLKGDGGRISENTLKLRLASVYEKQGKRDEAVNLLFGVVEGARKAQGKDGAPAPRGESAVVRAAGEKLRELSPERYAQLPPEPAPAGLLPGS
jgi:tetratricopeptide (TPR) repeat protein